MTGPEKHLNNKYDKVVSEFETERKESEDKQLSYGYGIRHLQCLTLFFTLCIVLIARTHISASIVAMTDVPRPKTELANTTAKFLKSNENRTEFNGTFKSEDGFNFGNDTEFDESQFDQNVSACNRNESNFSCDTQNNTSSFEKVNRVYDWPKSIQEMILGSFFLGYMIMMSPMGLVCQRYGGKLPLQISLFFTSLVNLVTPWLPALWGYKAVSLSRVLLGLTQAGTYPSINLLISKWVPANERGRLASFVYVGSMFGSILAYNIAGYLAVSRFGWPSIFWATGIISFVMFLLVTWIVSPSPQQNRYISEEEKNYILGGVKDQTEKRYPTPWKAIMTSKPAWACFFAHIGSGLGFLIMFSQIPTYLHHVLRIDIKNSGMLSSLPYFGNLIMSIILGVAADYVVNKKIMTTKQVRIFANSLSSLVPAITMMAVSFIDNSTLAVSCLVLCTTSQCGVHLGWMLNYIDLAPNFSGAMMATGNTMLNIGGVILPILVSQIVTDMTDIYQWRKVFFMVGGIAIFCNIISIIFVSDQIQPWNTPVYEETEQEDPDLIEKKRNEESNMITALQEKN